MLADLSIFLAAPYQVWMDFRLGRVEESKRVRLDALRRGLIEHGANVFNAHHNEGWGEGWLPPDICTITDFEAMRVADAVCVIGNPPSGGVAVEVGWASALQKPILLLFDDDGASASQLLLGIGEVVPTRVLTHCPWWERETIDDIADILGQLAAEPVPARTAPRELTVAGYVSPQRVPASALR
jgi:nucleoside 2-deoxyribosyltransferase